MSATPMRGAGRRLLGRATALVAVVATTGLLAGCGSSDGASSASAGAGGGKGADVTAAKAEVAKFSGRPSRFPVTKALSKPVAPGTRFVYLQSSDPIGALFAQLLKPAVTAIGGDFIPISAGATASSAQAAASSALAKKPAVVLIPAFVPSSFGTKLDELKAGGAKIVGAGMVGSAKYGIDWCVGCEPFNARNGKLMADWVVANKGDKADVAFYSVPEFQFTKTVYDGFTGELKKLCPECKVRDVPVGVAQIGSRAPQTMVNDLQSHPDSNVAVFSAGQMAQGMPAAMRSAGVDVDTIGAAPTPQNLQDLKADKLSAAVATDLATYTWTMVDAGARLASGERPAESEALSPVQILSPKDVTFNPQQGWSGYPDFPQRFAKLWRTSGTGN